jgi:hypothetical protein
MKSNLEISEYQMGHVAQNLRLQRRIKTKS